MIEFLTTVCYGMIVEAIYHRNVRFKIGQFDQKDGNDYTEVQCGK